MAACRIVYVGRLEEDTGLLTYLSALQLIKRHIPNMKVDFLGDGPIKSVAGKYGKVHGFVKYPKKYISSARFIFTSGYLSMLEALSLKKLVFATYDNPIKRNYLINSPFSKYTIIEKDPELLAKKVVSIWKNPNHEKMLTTQGYNWASKQTWGKVADLYLKIWNQK